MALLPIGANQPYHAARWAQLGVAQVLGAVEATPESVGKAVTTVLAEPGYRLAAECIRAEIAALPEPTQAISLLERLAVERRPLSRRDTR